MIVITSPHLRDKSLSRAIKPTPQIAKIAAIILKIVGLRPPIAHARKGTMILYGELKNAFFPGVVSVIPIV